MSISKTILIGAGLLSVMTVTAAQHGWILNHTAFDKKKPHWTFSGWRTAGYSSGSFEGWGMWRHQYLTSPEVKINADKFKYLEMYIDNFGTALLNQLQFSLDGKTFLPANAVNFVISPYNLPLPQKITVECSGNANWKGTIKKFRIYFPPRSEGSQIRIYGMQFVERPDVFFNGNFLAEKSGLPLNWNIKGKVKLLDPEKTSSGAAEMALADGAVVSSELKHMHNGHYYKLEFEAEGKVAGTVKLYDSTGKLVEELECKQDAGEGKWKELSVAYQVPEAAFKGELMIASQGNSKICNVRLRHLGANKEYWKASWIWTPAGAKNQQTCYFRKTFSLDKSKLKSAMLQTTCDDGVRVYLNGKHLFGKADWSQVDVRDVTQDLKNGENVLAARGFNGGGGAGLLLELKLCMQDGTNSYIVTDGSWKVCDEPLTSGWLGLTCDKGIWKDAKVLGMPPCSPWATIPYSLFVPKAAEPLPPLSKMVNHGIKYTIDTQLGYPRLKAGNKVLAPFIFGPPWRGDIKESVVTSKLSGFDLYRFPFEFGTAWKHDSYDVDMSGFDRDMETLLRANPEARVIVNFRITAPPWWMEKYPDEVCKFSDGKTDGHYGLLPSTASRQWIEDGKKYLKKMVSHIEQAYYADRVIGYMPCSHSGPEWVVTTKPNHFPDYSKPMLKYFREFLKRKYKDVNCLRKAWRDDKVSFENAQIPGRDARGTRQCYFLDPAASQAVFDYNRCLQESVSGAMLEFQKYIKELSDERRLNFVYYGYITELTMLSIYPLTTGHYDLTRVLNSPYLNGASSPIPYTLRSLGDVSGCSSVVSSYRLHDKLWINEADVRTNLTIDSFGHKDAYNLKDAVSVNIREFAYVLTRRLGIWYYDMTGGWFDNPVFIKTFREMRGIYDYAIERPIKYQSKVAVFFDEKSLDWASLQCEKWGGSNIQQIMGRFRIGLGKAGVPCDTFVLDDVYLVDPGQYKCYIFINAWRRNDTLKQYLDEKIRRNGNMVVWIHAPGYSGDELSLDNMRYMTGMEFGLARNTRLEITTNFGGKFTTGAPGITPNETFYVKSPSALRLGSYADNGKTALAMLKEKDWSTVYMGAPDDTGKVWRSLFKAAGIHLLCSRRDRIYYDGEFLGIHLIDGSGRRTIHLDRDASEAWDIFADRKLAVKDRKFEVSGQPGETKLFYLDNPDSLKQKIKEAEK